MKSPDIVQFLADRQSITELLYRYCRSVDRLDIPLGHSVWHEDGYADYGQEYYQGPGRGVIDLICRHHQSMLHHSHQLSNVLIELDGDSAASEAYVTATLRLQRDDSLVQITVWSRYIDQWSRRDGRWGIDKRIAVRDFDEVRDVTEMQRHKTGSRDRNDPSYAIFESRS